MLKSKFTSGILPLVLLAFFTLGLGNAYSQYPISISWRGGYDPMVFSLSSIIEGNLADVEDLEFGDLDPFFDVVFSQWSGGGTPESPLYLWVRFVTGDNQVIFSVRSRNLVDAADFVGRSFNNQTLAGDPFNLGEFGEQAGINESLALSLIDNSLLRDGFYRLIVALSDEPNWNESILGNNSGIAILSVHVQNPTQIRILQPQDEAELRSNPMFIWRFPRQAGVTFNLSLVKGEANQSAAEAMDSPAEANIFLDVNLNEDDFVGEGVNIFVYTGIGDQRPLDDGMYFWQVTATVPGAFPGEWFTYESPIYSFMYSGPGGGGAPFGGGGAGNPPPNEMSAIFAALQNLLPAELFEGLLNAFGNPADWRAIRINVDGRDMSIMELVRWYMQNEPTIVMISIS